MNHEEAIVRLCAIDIGEEIFDVVDVNILGVWFGAVATLLGAIGTVTAVFVAIHNAKQARDASIKAQETADAARQDALNVRREAAEERKRAQADQICAWIHGDYHKNVLALLNSSDQPVYSVAVYWVWVQGAAWSTGEQAERQFSRSGPEGRIGEVRPILQVVPPGKFFLRAGVGNQDIMQGRPGVEVAFTDMTGHHWVRRASGTLEQLDAGPFDHYGIGPHLPVFTPLTPWEQAELPT
jgi:hypothetical protein